MEQISAMQIFAAQTFAGAGLESPALEAYGDGGRSSDQVTTVPKEECKPATKLKKTRGHERLKLDRPSDVSLTFERRNERRL